MATSACFPGCTNHRYVDAHHVRHWADGGETKLANLVLLCRHHHGAIHEAGWSIELETSAGPETLDCAEVVLAVPAPVAAASSRSSRSGTSGLGRGVPATMNCRGLCAR